MATRSQVDGYEATIHGLTTLAFADLKALLLALDNPNPITFRDALLATYPELLHPYMGASAEVAAAWYDELRLGASVAGTFTAAPKITAPDAQLDAGVRYALTPLFKPAPVTTVGGFIGDTILSLLAGFTQHMIANAGRDTISGNAYDDPVRVGWARVPTPGCCSFCGLMASRGPVYSSAEAASTVFGRGVDASETAGKRGGQGRGVKVRGSQRVGDSYHDHCRCVATPVFPGGDNALVFDTASQYTGMLGDLESADGSPSMPGQGLTLKGVLADWRFTHGTK